MRYRNFRLFFLGLFISMIGTWMQQTALQWLVYQLTGSQFLLGVVAFANFLPVLLFSLFMGVIIDRYSNRTLLYITQIWFMIVSLILAVLTIAGVIQYWQIIILALLSGLATALDMPTRQSFYVELVDRKDLMNAIALNSSVFNGARIIGPAIAGIIIAQIGEGTAFAINTVTYLALIGALALMVLPKHDKSEAITSGIAELKEGIRYLINDRIIFGLVLMVALFSALGFAYLTLLPVFAQDVLRSGPEGYGSLLAAQGFGALAGALSLAFLGERFSKARMLQFSRFMLPVALLLLTISRNLFLSMFAVVLAGFALITMLAVTNTLIQLLSPDKVRGRIMSTFTWALGGFFPLGSLLIGAVGDRIGAVSAVAISVVICFMLAVAGNRLFLLPENDILQRVENQEL
jgi:MFS family permease